MPWRTAPERSIPEAAAELTAAFGDALRTLVLYGSAARAAFRPDRSDINLAVVAEPLAFDHLQRVAHWWRRWRRHGYAPPLLLSLVDLERSRDVFPLELLDLRTHHRTLAGAELFATLSPAPECVRAACEREAKSTLVHLRELYLEAAGSTRDVRALMLDARKTVLLVMRGLLSLRGEPWAGDDARIVERFERGYRCRLPTLAGVDPVHAGEPLEERFAAFLAEVAELATIADGALAPSA